MVDEAAKDVVFTARDRARVVVFELFDCLVVELRMLMRGESRAHLNVITMNTRSSFRGIGIDVVALTVAGAKANAFLLHT